MIVGWSRYPGVRFPIKLKSGHYDKLLKDDVGDKIFSVL